jgi:hypothetical protein
MRPTGIPAGRPEARSRERQLYLAILLALPAVTFLLNRNWTFQGFGDYDAFYYFGHFIHFPHYQKLQPRYPGERLSWVLPGFAFVHLFGAVYGTLLLHFLAYYISVFSLFSIVTRFCGPQAGFLASLALGTHPYFLSVNGIEYVTGACIAYCLLTLALLMRSACTYTGRRWAYLFLAGASWAGAIYAYPFWLLFTPACLIFYLAARDSAGEASLRWSVRFKDTVVAAGFFAAGGAALTLIFMLTHYLIFGEGWLAFQRNSIESVRYVSHMEVSPWASKSFSVTYADWLVFPGLAAGLSIILAIPYFRRSLALRAGTGKLLLMYLYFFGVMVFMTIRPGRILQFDIFTSFLLPGAFIVFGVTIFSFPTRLPPWFWLVLACACGISLAPLAWPGLYVKPPAFGAIVPAGLAGLALAIRLLRPRSIGALIVMVLGLPGSTFCLAPSIGGIAWRDSGDWMSATDRVATVVKTVENRLAREAYPVFWYNETSPRNLEFQAIMCSFLSHGVSMLNYPEVTPERHFMSGQVVVLLTDQSHAFDAASKAMASRGMPLAFLWEQQVSRAGVSYWVTATEIR